ncbi:MAG: hypothetical protein UY49_C0005G0002 [Microgenomates group bacterium GW2011_GWC1_49_7]|nr:MAG: hypothetical protein UY49_C0005G0002 [Microgenomates group bacterium GW2011_GWC1_49_7]
MTKNETKNQAKEALAPITISFGDVIVSKDPDQKLVIVDIGKGKWCAGSAIMEIDGKEAINLGKFGGTLWRDDIKEIIDHWDMDRIIAAINTYLRTSGSSGTLFDALRKNSVVPSRILK